MLDKVILAILCILIYLLKNITSNHPNIIKFKFNFFIMYVLSSALAVVIWPLFLMYPNDVQNLKKSAAVMKHMTKIFAIKWILRNGEIVAEDRGAVIVSNHQSALDVLGMFNIWAVIDKMTVVAKKEIFYLWPFGLAAYLAGVEFIDRRDPKGAYEQLNAIGRRIFKKKIKLWLFPEGTRNKDPSKLLPFKKGAFVAAVNAQVPVIPVVFSPYYFIDSKKYIFEPGHVIIQCLEPEYTVGLTNDDVPDLINRVRAKMEAAYSQLSKEIYSPLMSNKTQKLSQNK